MLIFVAETMDISYILNKVAKATRTLINMGLKIEATNFI